MKTSKPKWGSYMPRVMDALKGQHPMFIREIAERSGLTSYQISNVLHNHHERFIKKALVPGKGTGRGNRNRYALSPLGVACLPGPPPVASFPIVQFYPVLILLHVKVFGPLRHARRDLAKQRNDREIQRQILLDGDDGYSVQT